VTCEVDVIDDEHELLARDGITDRARDERDRLLVRRRLDAKRGQALREAHRGLRQVFACERDDAVVPQVGNQARAYERRFADAWFTEQQTGSIGVRSNKLRKLVSLGLAPLPDVSLCFTERI
jgi:hypothetical protein